MSHTLGSPDQILSTLTRDGKRRWLYPVECRGFWQKRRKLLAWLLICFYIVAPFIYVDGKQLLLFDILGGRFSIFGTTFYATDTLLLLLFLLCVIFFIIWMTAVSGRAWCGWGCPQTVYLEFVFRPIERLIEGSETSRARRDLGPLTFDYLWRKVAKYSLYIFISFILSNVFVAYFVGSDRLLQWMQMSPVHHPGPFLFMLGMTGAILFNFAYFREQMCTIACPYARWQSVMIDRDSLIVKYHDTRGEPRGKGRSRDSLGDCIDCGMCVRVCPTGIDIREGLQMECIHCTQCIDACDDVMRKVKKPVGLISYGSIAAEPGKPSRVLRPRTALYSAGLLVLVCIFILALVSRAETEVQLLRASQAPYRLIDQSMVSNHLELKIRNLTDRQKSYVISGISPAEARFISPTAKIEVAPSSTETITVFVTFPSSILREGMKRGELQVTDENSVVVNAEATLLGPKG